MFLPSWSLTAAPGDEGPGITTLGLALRDADGSFWLTASLDGEVIDEGRTVPRVHIEEVHQALEAISGRNQVGSSRRGLQMAVDPVIGLGSRLFGGLMQGNAGLLYQKHCMENRPGSHLRLLLDAPAGSLLEELPWELLYDPVRSDFPALSRQRSLIRVARPSLVPARPGRDRPPRVLVLAMARPNGPAGVPDEASQIERINDAADRPFELTVVRKTTIPDLAHRLRHEQFDVLHFAGDGVRLNAGLTTQGQAILVPDALEGNRFRAMLEAQEDLRLLCLNASHTHRMARDLTGPAANVVGMHGRASDDFCSTFASGLFGALAQGSSAEEAVTAARGHCDTTNPGGREWGLAVLYTGASGPVQVLVRGPTPVQADRDDGSAPADPARRREWERLRRTWVLMRRNLQLLEDQARSIQQLHAGLSEMPGSGPSSDLAVRLDELRGQELQLRHGLERLERG